jgi:hypothetical protein
MINNLKDACKFINAIEFANGIKVTVSGGLPTARNIKINGRKVMLPLTNQDFMKEVKASVI